jgi:thioredoxin 1
MRGCLNGGITAILLFLSMSTVCFGSSDVDFNSLPVKGMVTMIDLGAKKCVPCKMMAPILVELEKEYAGRASIVFIDVWKHRDQAKRFGVRSIPTQIFFDKEGKEVGRHVGFMDKRKIQFALENLGVPKEGGQ